MSSLRCQTARFCDRALIVLSLLVGACTTQQDGEETPSFFDAGARDVESDSAPRDAVADSQDSTPLDGASDAIGGDTRPAETRIDVIALSPTPSEELMIQAAELVAEPTTVAFADGRIVVGHDEGADILLDGALRPMSVYGVDREFRRTGAVHDATPLGDLALFAAEEGVFYSERAALVVSPLSEVWPTATAIHAIATPDDGAEIWAVVDGELGFTAHGERYSVALRLPSPPLSLAASPMHVLIRTDGGLHVWERMTGVVSPCPVPFDEVRGLTASDNGTLWAATDAGLLRFDGAWTQYTFGEDVNARPVHAVAAWPAGGVVVALDDALVLVDGPALVAVAALDDTALTLAADGDRVALVTRTHLWTLDVGEPPSFAADVAPVFDAACASCHEAGELAPLRDFTDYAQVIALLDSISERISIGQMPPRSSDPLSDTDLRTVLAWRVGGLLP